MFSARPLPFDELTGALAISPVSSTMDNLFASEDIRTICSTLVTLGSSEKLKLKMAHIRVKSTFCRIVYCTLQYRRLQSPRSRHRNALLNGRWLVYFATSTNKHLIDATSTALWFNPYTLKEFSTNQCLCCWFTGKSTEPKTCIRCYWTDEPRNN